MENTMQLYQKYSDFWCRATLELLNRKTLFQSQIVEQHKSYMYSMVLESRESIQGNQVSKRTTFCEHLRVACTEVIAAELMNVSRL